jgi:penicillin-binding protein 1A
MRAAPGDTKVILEAFKPGTAPPDSYSVIGADTGAPTAGAPDGGNVVRTGTGGLY